MAFQVSPGVNVSEVDLTTVIPAVASTVGGLVGNFSWGPVNEIISVSTENELVDKVGVPTSNTYEYFLTAANFLAYANNLKVVRANTGAKNATSAGTGKYILNLSDYESTVHNSNTNFFTAKYPGSLGNQIGVSVVDSDGFSTWEYKNLFESAPSTSVYASNNGASNDELHVLVFNTQSGEILEKFDYVSKASDAKNYDGSANYYVDVVNRSSNWVWFEGHTALQANANTVWGSSLSNGLEFDSLTGNVTVQLSGATDSSSTNANNAIVSSLDLFANQDSVELSLLMTGSSDVAVINKAIDIAESRKDCIVFFSPSKSDVVNTTGQASKIETSVNSIVTPITRSTFAFMDCNYKYQYNKYDDRYYWVPMNGDVAGLCVRTDNQRDPWYSIAGFNRGYIKNVVKLAWNPTQSDRDTLYKNGVNAIVSFPGEGTVLFGDKTFVNKPSAFDHINVRRLFIVLEKAISKAARSSLFEFNDEFTRASFINLVEPFLRDVKGRRGVYDFRVVCDSTNNTGEVIDSNRFVGDIYIKPARSINYIQLNFVAVRTSVSFQEITGQF